ncbi:hypothetical protein SAMN05216588_104260 [Pseudomonas flavescens]|uniref:Helix-turn-helix domain-containing protein n=1 Tax=Phytopseudomonas flavescens TaxID=29435 RepID=A0A1G8C480_9GAMM|nr:helix-turn-helix domain-containing protein [Pseudomonas flavescens]SDH40128.1 hypothetical protein SAMN05216588_104260 [Pseudomonas flavescens]
MEELDLSHLPNSPRYVTVRRFAELIGLGEDRVQTWIDDGLLPVTRIAGHVLIDMQRLGTHLDRGRS